MIVLDMTQEHLTLLHKKYDRYFFHHQYGTIWLDPKSFFG